MKLHLAIIAIAMMISSNYAGVAIGIKGGLSLYEARLTYGSEGETFSNYFGLRIGPSATLFGEIEQNKNLFHNLQLNYYQAGGKGSVDIVNELGVTTGKGWHDLALNYIGLGYNFIYKKPISNIAPYASIGLSVDYLANIKERINWNGSTENVNSFEGAKLNRINLRPLISTGLEYKLSRISLLLDYTFSYNLLPFYQHSVDAMNIGANHTTDGHIINIGCKYNIK
jgi:hypothetical protein